MSETTTEKKPRKPREKKTGPAADLKAVLQENMTLTARVAELEEALATSQKNEQYAKTNRDEAYKAKNALDEEVEQIHLFLDAIPGATGRKTKFEDYPHERPNKAMTRLAGWLATK